MKLAEEILAAAQATPQGRARIALGAALSDTPGWFTPLSPEPARERFCFAGAKPVSVGFGKLIFRSCLRFEQNSKPARAETFRGTPDIDYGIQLLLSPNRDEVWALYQTAGLSLIEDIETLNRAARIKANPSAVQYLEQNIIFDGEIHIPVLTMHTTGDGLVINENESAYRTIVDLAGNHNFLRQTFVSRAGHCAFTPAETIAAVGTLLTRVGNRALADCRSERTERRGDGAWA